MPFYQLFNISIEQNKILIFEPNTYHHECTPGYTKYFIDLGYNVDILMHYSGIDSFYIFPEVEKVRLLIFKSLKEITVNAKNISFIIKKYDFVLLQTTDKTKKNLYIKLGILNISNSIFVFHDYRYINFGYLNYLNQNRIWTLGNFPKGLRVNPHYFGNIRLKEKKNKTKFFIISTRRRNYRYLVDCATKLKNENFDFEIIVVGRTKAFQSKMISQNLFNNFIFKYKVCYSDLYRAVESSDYILLLFDPKRKCNRKYKKFVVTGSMQLVYGFLKIAIIHKEFTNFYNLSDENSLIYNNFNLYDVMKQAIILNNKEYKRLQNNLLLVERKIYKSSINNINYTKKTIIYFKKIMNEFFYF